MTDIPTNGWRKRPEREDTLLIKPSPPSEREEISLTENGAAGPLLERLSALPSETQRMIVDHLNTGRRPRHPASKALILAGLKEKIPLSIFCEEIGLVECAVLYLHDERNYTFADIARLLARNAKSVWASYQCAKQKRTTPLHVDKKSGLTVPLTVLRDTQLGALEAVSYHLREKRQLSFREIGDLLCRHENTIRTAHQRARFKHLMKV